MAVRIGIDNGVSGSIGILRTDEPPVFVRTADLIRTEQDYVKTKRNINRIQPKMLYDLLRGYSEPGLTKVMLERPMIDPVRFRASISAVRALECTQIVLEMLGLGFEFLDSKRWQKLLLPEGVKGSAALKKASAQTATRLFPSVADVIAKQKDGDGLLIAEYCRRYHNLM